LLDFLYPNPHDNYKLEGRKAIFNSDNKSGTRSLILKEGTKDLIIEVFELFYFVIIFIVNNILYLLFFNLITYSFYLYFFIYRKIKYERKDYYGCFLYFIFKLIYLF
jgi:hypothetical protein